MANLFDLSADWPEPELVARRITRIAELELWIGVLRDELDRRRRRKAPLLSPGERQRLQSLISEAGD